MAIPMEAGDASLIERGLLFSYAKGVGIYRCPSDRIINVRSYSMQPQFGLYFNGAPYNGQASAGYPGYPTIYRENQIEKPPPSQTMVHLDENPTTLNDGFFFVAVEGDKWTDLPGVLHRRGGNFSFADNHSEYWRWKDSRTVTLAPMATTPNNPDLKRVQAAVALK